MEDKYACVYVYVLLGSESELAVRGTSSDSWWLPPVLLALYKYSHGRSTHKRPLLLLQAKPSAPSVGRLIYSKYAVPKLSSV